MVQAPPPSTHPTDPAHPETVETGIKQYRTLYYPDSIESLRAQGRSALRDLGLVAEPVLTKIRGVERVVLYQIRDLLGKDAEQLTADCLSRIDPLVIAASTLDPERANLGFTTPIAEDRYYIVLALSDLGRHQSIFEMAGTMFHELTHAADFNCSKVDIGEYREIYIRYHKMGILDPHSAEVINLPSVSKTEFVARAFQSVFFGLPGACKSIMEMKNRVRVLRKICPELVQLVEQDFYQVYSEIHDLRTTRRIAMTTTQVTFRPLKEREGWEDQRVNWYFRKFSMDPLYRGTFLWLREQALQAERDPNREWDGLQAEWDKLVAGTHPDPHPELIIYGHHLDDFDPTTLRDPSEMLHFMDDIDYTVVVSENPIEQLDYPPRSQQLYAAVSRRQVEHFLNHDIETTEKFGKDW